MQQVLKVCFSISLCMFTVHCARLHHNDVPETKGFHYHYEVLPSTLPVQGATSGTGVSSVTSDTMKVEESRSAFGYRKPSSEYRVVDFLADAYGFSRKNTFNFPTSSSTTSTSSPVTTPATTTTVAAVTTTTSAPVTMSPLRLLSSRTATTNTDYADDSDEEEETTMPSSPPPPAPLRLAPISSKTSTSSSSSSSSRFSSEQQVKMDLDNDSEDDTKSVIPTSPGRLMKQSFKDRQSHIEQEREKEEVTTVFPTTMSPISGSLKTPSGRLLAPRVNQGISSVDYETKTSARAGSTSTSAPSVASTSSSSIDEDSTLLTESMKNRISVHQLVAESMPSVSMSIVPVYFVNRVTKSVITVPYLTMKSISKMPLLPGMYGGDNSGTSTSVPPMMNGLLKLQSHRIQRSNVKSGPSLFKLLQSSSTNNNQIAASNPESDSLFDDDTSNSNESPIKSFSGMSSSSSSSSGNSESDWVPINVNNNPSSGLTSISDQW